MLPAIGIVEVTDPIKALAALAQSNRLQILRALVVHGPDGMKPATIAKALSLPAATLSFYLQELLNANLNSQKRSDRNLIYQFLFERINAVLSYLTDNCCHGDACQTETTAGCGC